MDTQGKMSRREMLALTSSGFGAMAFTGVAPRAQAATSPSHYAPKAKHVIFCYMHGGVSHVDSFDPKPRLQRDHGKPMPMKIERTQFNINGNIFGSPFPFTQYGDCGLPVSSMFPHVGSCADDLAVIRSMTSTVNEHAQGNYFFHTGTPLMGRPSAGAWVSYGLGTESENLPAFVVLQSGGARAPHGGAGLYSNGFLPGQHQGSILQGDSENAVRNLQSWEPPANQRNRLDFINTLDQRLLQSAAGSTDVDAAIKNYETAFRMQATVPDMCSIAGESKATKKLYGLDHPNGATRDYGRQCLLARRLVERGVRFIELTCSGSWDQHDKLEEGHARMSLQVDQPIAGLIKDLKARGLLDETLVIWASEFGRTPFSQGTIGRDHNPFGFSMWMAGGGIKGGTTYGATDEFGYHVVEDKTTVYDTWATVLHLLGMDHELLTFRHGGRDHSLTDVHGKILHPIIS
jgi:uncharacterized protein (DUF1501 family)